MALRWFVDESALGLGKLLAGIRDDVTFAGHLDLPEIPLGTMDVGWMPIVAARDWVAIRRDRRIHTRPLEVRVFSEVGLRTVWLGGKKDMGAHQQLDLVIRGECWLRAHLEDDAAYLRERPRDAEARCIRTAWGRYHPWEHGDGGCSGTGVVLPQETGGQALIVVWED